ncbi:MAG: ABC transporter permease [Solirubrobacterales bacterium]|nr:ABC transporter permease [Solirubrobacterales bacterium]
MSLVKRQLLQWETTLAAAVVTLFLVSAATVPGFASSINLSLAAAGVSEVALMVVPLALLIIAREIDLSIASIAGLASVSLGVMIERGVPLGLAIPLVLLIGVAAGALNGALVAWLRLPSLVVTLGTLALFRGLCYIILGPRSVSVLPEPFTDFGISNVPGTAVPLTIVPFVVVVVIVGVVLHRTATGRRIYAIGGSPETALYSGVRVQRMTFWLFVLSGAVCAVAGIVYTARLGNARADSALGFELDAVTIAFLGGISVFGGKGTMAGVGLALILIALVKNVLGLNQVNGDAQATAIGALLIGSVLLNNLARSISEHARARREARVRAAGQPSPRPG